MSKIGKQLRRFRLERGLTHRDLAREVGITETAVSNIERDKSEPNGDTWEKLADALGVKMDDLREPREPVSPSDLEAKLMDAAKRAQGGDASALAEMRRLYSQLGQADAARVESERSRPDEKRRRVRKQQ